MNLPAFKYSQIHQDFYHFINQDVLPLVNFDKVNFWDDFEQLVAEFTPRNQALLAKRRDLQKQIDGLHRQHQGQPDQSAYQGFLRQIGYIALCPEQVEVNTTNVDAEIASMAGPQLVVPVSNARFALNAANARWGSLYDAFYGTDAIDAPAARTKCFDPERGKAVVAQAKAFLDEYFPLAGGSHKDVASYEVYYHHLLAFFTDGSQSGLVTPCQFVAFNGQKCSPSEIVLQHNQLHVEIVIDRGGDIGASDSAHVQDILLESALTTIMDLEDSVAAVDAQDKINAYRNWLGLMQADLTASFDKQGETVTRAMNADRIYTDVNGEEYRLKGRSLLLVRNVGHLMDTELMQDHEGNLAPEGIIDAVVTALIAMVDLQKQAGIRNSETGSIYIVKPKMHGPEEVAFSCDLFAAVENLLGLEKNTLKIGIMDEERRTSVNLKACIHEARERVFFINTGFLDRTGDEIHTSMHAGAFLPKDAIKTQPWISAYENSNVAIGMECGLVGQAQIGKGMWPMPDEMRAMMAQKTVHTQSGASTAWVPSPTAATLHVLHYHQTDVASLQSEMLIKLASYDSNAARDDLLTIPLLPKSSSLSEEEIDSALKNNAQGILGYVARWVKLGIGCSKVPDINNVGLMEDRATLRISSQHIANWLVHGICTQQQVETILREMAVVVDQQNASTPGYTPMTENLEDDLAFNAARRLVFEGKEQPNGYTEPLLHYFRRLAKAVGTH